MITAENLKYLLIYLGYQESNGKYTYHFKESNCDIIVDFINEKIIYPTDKGLIVNERQITNFLSDENFVVLECIHRLLEKGYLPYHIEVEKKWSLGHLQKSGRADICVMNATGNDMLFIIECKTFGGEFEKELKTLKADGGQLFSYLQQEKSTKWLMLYASDFKDGKLLHQTKTIPVFDTEDVLERAEKDNGIYLYKRSNSKEKTFQTWIDTYDQKIYDDLIFSEDTIAYNIGEKPLRKKDLKEFNPRDKIVNKFEEILRHNNVSDKENAFNKLTALFICKLVDEINKDEDDIVEFQYKFGTDTYETLLDRLQRLYKEGMDKFMKEEIFYVSSEYPLNLFSIYNGSNRKNAIEDLKETFRKLKFYSNSDFAFKDVHNEELFQQNGKILVEVIKLFEPYRIVYSSKHQFLGDLFEQLLNQGFKQNEGQFFTPIPITRFIWESLPLDNLKSLSKSDGYPKIIDYACGSGHFLTEGIDIINKLNGNNSNNWIKENIYGIEKDYRLARVSKISLFMNGAGEGNIIFGDGLDNHKDKGIENNSFDILVANPPYSVKSFKSHLELRENNLKLTEFISNEGGEIEVLFVERISQLLKPNGVAAVILPSSILSTTSNSFIEARNDILKNFKLKSIIQFGNKTFGATGTNTVVLFLEKYNEPPRYFKMIEDSIQAIFNGEKNFEWSDNEILSSYIEHIRVDKEIYLNFLEENLNFKDLAEDIYFKMYVDDFINSTDLKNIENRAYYKKLKENEKIEIINNVFYKNIKEIEKDKMFYFALVRDQKTLVVKSPTKITDQYKFLGYKWSNRKGNEGIQIDDMGGILFDPNNRNSTQHISAIIRSTFENNFIEYDKSLKEYVDLLNTKDMLEFKRVNFDKSIRLTAESIIQTKYKLSTLGEVTIFIKNGKDVKQQDDKGEFMVSRIETISSEKFNFKAIKYTNDLVEENNFWDKGDIALSHINSLEHLGKTAYFNSDVKIIHGINTLRIKVDESIIRSRYLYFITKLNYFKEEVLRLCKRAVNQASINQGDLSTIKIPLPPIDVQDRIIINCEKLEKKYEDTRMKIEDYRSQIQKIFEDLEVIKNDVE